VGSHVNIICAYQDFFGGDPAFGLVPFLIHVADEQALFTCKGFLELRRQIKSRRGSSSVFVR
jgi:hypothetical protein